MHEYDHKAIEKKWQEIWEKTNANVASDNPQKKKYYCLIEFPYPSGEGLHVGHVRSNTAMDVIARKRRAEGFNVLYPIGWDAFGLPTENYAVKTGIHPIEVTKQNSDNFRRQLKSMGFSFDWSREINTSDPAYYKWTQWIFLKFLERGLAYKKRMVINWCPKDKTGLANEEVIDGNCERCGTPVEKKEKEQWMLAITKYADRLDKDLDTVNYLPEIKTQQRNWIGKSVGTELDFLIQSENPKKLPKKILIGTRNEAKIRMFREAFQGITVELISLNDLAPVDDSKLVEGDDYRENARLKSKFYFEKTGIPTLSTDQIQWVEKYPNDGGFIVHARKLANPKSPRATDEEVGSWIEKLVEEHGESNATFYYAISYTDNNGTKDFVNIQREYTLQKEKSSKKNDGYVFDRYMKDKETGKFRIEQPFKIAFSKFDDFIRNEFLLSFGSEEKVKVFTTRADTLFGTTYLVFAPEHRLIQSWKKEIKNWTAVEKYISDTKKKSEIERTSEGKEKTGVELKGIKAINPANGTAIPVFVADYVLIDYGTGAIMAVPAHDERDYEFATKYKLPIREVIEPLIVKNDGEDSIRQNVPFTERHAVVCVIKHWSENKYLGLRWKKNGWQGFVIGGVEKGETPVAAGIREIIEETGYQHPVFEKKLGGMVHSKFYQAVKNENRFAHFEPLFFTLKDGAKNEIADNEKALHDICWLSEKELLSFVNRDDMKIIATRISDGNVYIGEGMLVNSDRFNGFYNRDAIKAITEYVAGKSVVKYKLRDWIFSRQRYWGEPIPVIHCDHCKEQKQKVLIIHGFEGAGNWNWIPWMKRELEAQGFEVMTPTMSTAKHPDLKTWMKELAPHMKHFGPNDIVIGHSLGSKAALHLLLQSKKKIGSLLLVASAIGELQERDWQRMKERWIGSDIEALKKFWLAPIDLKKISKYARRVSIVISKDDTSVPLHTHERLPKEWNFEMWNGFKHFSKTEIPELLSWVLRAKATGIVPVPEKDLPVKLPNVKEFKPRDDGESPLASAKKWVEVKCPQCGKKARRETDTMPNWAGSSWYYLRYIDPANDKEFASSSKLSYWLPVDWYNGGMEHTTLHLLYSRFWHKFLFDLKLVPTNEPYQKRTAHGMILAEGGVKMSKSKGNVINPDTIVETVGADTLRVYEMFLGPFDQAIAWDPSSIAGSRRFLEKVWRLQSKIASGKGNANREIETLLNQAIKKVGEDIENIRFNTAISQLMILTNAFEKEKEISRENYQTLLRLIAPFAPHIAEELWEITGEKKSIHDEQWPTFDPSKLSSETAKIVVQINGKVRGTVEVETGAVQSDIEAKVRSDKALSKWLEAGKIMRIFFVPNRLINFVIEEKKSA